MNDTTWLIDTRHWWFNGRLVMPQRHKYDGARGPRGACIHCGWPKGHEAHKP